MSICKWIQNGVQCNESVSDGRIWCNDHLKYTFEWISSADKIISDLKKSGQIRDNLIGVQTELIEVLEETIEEYEQASKMDKQLIAFLQDKYEPSSDDEW